MTKDEQIANQAGIIFRLNATNAGLRKKLRKANEGRRQALAALAPEKEPETADEWKSLIAKAMAEIEAEDGEA